MAKLWAKWFYNSKSWIECKNAYIKSVFNLCEDCKQRGISKPGHIVHHKIELTPDNIHDTNITLNWDNLRYLCLDCHNRVDSNEVLRNDVMFDSNGQLIERK